MAWKSLLVIVACYFLCQISLAAGPTNVTADVRVGDCVMLEFTGTPAISILRLRGSKSFDAVKDGSTRFCIPLKATVTAINESGEVQVQHLPALHTNAEGTTRMVTATVNFDKSRLVTPDIYAPRNPIPQDAPDGLDEILFKTRSEQAKLPLVRLDNMKGIWLKAWDMVEEVAE